MSGDVYEKDADRTLLAPEPVDDVQSDLVAADSNILTADIELPEDRYVLRVQVAVDPAATVSVTEANGDSYTLNAGSKLQAGALYEFDISGRTGREYNFQASQGTTISTLTVDRLPGSLG